MDAPLHLPADWLSALDRAVMAARTVVVGPTDVGKSSFVRALAARRPELSVLDLDPGQKMLGCPGTVSIGRLDPAPKVARFVFLGSTAVGSFRDLIDAAVALAASAGALVANSSGYVRGPGARLQAMTVGALAPDLVVAIAPPPALDQLLSTFAPTERLRLAPSPLARRKSPAQRRAIRQASFDAALAGAGDRTLARDGLAFDPAPPAPLAGEGRPVCALADADGEDMVVGLMLGADPDHLVLHAGPTVRPVRRIRLGMMWADRSGERWMLRERLSPAWLEAAG